MEIIPGYTNKDLFAELTALLKLITNDLEVLAGSYKDEHLMSTSDRSKQLAVNMRMYADFLDLGQRMELDKFPFMCESL